MVNVSVWVMCPRRTKGLGCLLPSHKSESYSRTRAASGFWEGLPLVRCGRWRGVLLEEASGPLWALQTLPIRCEQASLPGWLLTQNSLKRDEGMTPLLDTFRRTTLWHTEQYAHWPPCCSSQSTTAFFQTHLSGYSNSPDGFCSISFHKCTARHDCSQHGRSPELILCLTEVSWCSRRHNPLLANTLTHTTCMAWISCRLTHEPGLASSILTPKSPTGTRAPFHPQAAVFRRAPTKHHQGRQQLPVSKTHYVPGLSDELRLNTVTIVPRLYSTLGLFPGSLYSL